MVVNEPELVGEFLVAKAKSFHKSRALRAALHPLAGNGLFTSILLTKARGFDLPTSLGYYYLIGFTWNCFAVTIFATAGFADSRLMVPSTAGSMLGAYFGSRIGRSKGHGLIRALFVTIGGILGMNLALGW